MEDLSEANLLGWSASPKDTRRRRKMAQKVAAEVMNNDKKLVADSNCSYADGNGEYGPIAGCEVVTTVLIQLPVEGRDLAGSKPKWSRH